MKDISKKVRPLNDRVLVKEHADDKEKKTASGIIVPVGSSEERSSKTGEVVAVGPGRVDNGKIVAVNVKVGDKIIFQWGDKIRVDTNEYYMVRESEILAVIK